MIGNVSQQSRDIMDISTQCLQTALELLAELESLQLQSCRALRQAISKTFLNPTEKDFC